PGAGACLPRDWRPSGARLLRVGRHLVPPRRDARLLHGGTGALARALLPGPREPLAPDGGGGARRARRAGGRLRRDVGAARRGTGLSFGRRRCRGVYSALVVEAVVVADEVCRVSLLRAAVRGELGRRRHCDAATG